MLTKDGYCFDSRRGLFFPREKNYAPPARFPLIGGTVNPFRNAGPPGLLFHVPLLKDLLPTHSTGSPTPTFTRATGNAAFLSPFSGLIEYADTGVARFEANGYLTEGQRTNDVLWSNDPSNVAYDKTNMSTTGSITSPDGTSNAFTLTADAANATCIQDLGTIASDDKTYSVYLKRRTGAGNIDLTLNNGTAWTTQSITNDWVRYQITAVLADPDIGIRNVTSGDEVDVWMQQHEDNAEFPSSVITTTTDPVTRNQDLLNYPFLNNIIGGTDPGTVVIKFDVLDETVVLAQNIFFTKGASDNNRIHIDVSAFATETIRTIYGTGSGIEIQTQNYGVWPSGPIPVAFTYSSGGGELFTEGISRDSDVTATNVAGLTPLFMGADNGGSVPLYGHLQDFRTYDHDLTDTEILFLA